MILPIEQNKLDSSKLDDMERCPRYFFYRHVLGWEIEAPNNHLVFGTSWHIAMEHLLLNGYGDSSVIEAHNKMLAEYRKEFAPETDELFSPKDPNNAFVVLAQYAMKYQKELENLEVIYTEIAGEVAIDADHTIAFRMDSILREKDSGLIFSREHKTGSRTHLWDDQWLLARQPGTYSHVLYCLYPYEQVKGIEMNGSFFIKRKKDPFDFRRYVLKKRKDQMQVWMDNTSYYVNQVNHEYDILGDCTENEEVLNAFPLRAHNCFDYYRTCTYHDFCLAWPNPLRKMHEPPLGFRIRYWNPLEREAKQTFKF